MKKLIITLSILLSCSAVYAQECVPEDWCSAAWLPVEGMDRTSGKDSCGNTCIKIAVSSPVSEYLVFIHSEKEKNIPSTLQTYVNITAERPYVWHWTKVQADSYKSVSGYIVFYLGEKETARFLRDVVIGWKKL